MAKATKIHKDTGNAPGSVLTQRDADEFRKALRDYSTVALKTESSAKSTLRNLGTHTKTGQLSKRYSK